MVGLLLMAGGMAMEGFAKYRQSKKEKEAIKEQIAEIERQKAFVQQMYSRKQGELVREENAVVGEQKALAAKDGLGVSSGSPAGHRQSLRDTYGRAGETIGLQASEQIRQLTQQQSQLKRGAKDIVEAGRLNLFASLLGAGAGAVSGASKLGMFNKPELFSPGSTIDFLNGKLGSYGKKSLSSFDIAGSRLLSRGYSV